MTFTELKIFLTEKKKINDFSAPLLIKSLLEAGGTATLRHVAMALLLRDECQIANCEKQLKEVGLRLLSGQGIIEITGELISLNIPGLTLEQEAELAQICRRAMAQYTACHGSHSRNDCRPDNSEPAAGRRSGGPVIKKTGCPFCELEKTKDYILENELAFVKLDKHPITEGHSLIIPKRHFADCFDITKAEKEAVDELICIRRNELLASDETIAGFNVGANSGEAAGQTVFHCHIHLIPRRKEDGEILKDGIEGVIRRKLSRSAICRLS